ncbi:hypothetical protein PUN28_018962 [Cardiocondyla obscurior]|uniref:HBS1-like protein N-terminal domain-containing protein n=1 Tax=Cardiocondyla obscurior TaxID=286306 RepID=A0AAW2EGR4_9HYME
MSRHRDVRSMNYSDEYDGYDDVYGHSVEDDYCVSPTVEQFLFDRSKQQNIASFITEPDIVEDNEDVDESLPSSNEEKHNLSELERAKLESCLETIRNVIGDTVSDSKLKDKIILSNFDANTALDAILKESSPKQDADSAVNKKRLEQHPGVSLDKSNTSTFTIPRFSFKKENTLSEDSSRTICQSSSTDRLKDVNYPVKPFSSLAGLISHHTESIHSNAAITSLNDTKAQPFSSLAALTTDYLQKSNINNIQSQIKPQSISPFVIPKLSITKKNNEERDNAHLSKFCTSENNKTQLMSTNVLNNHKINLLEKDFSSMNIFPKSNILKDIKTEEQFKNPSIVNKICTPLSDDWVDLSTALKEAEFLVDNAFHNVNSASSKKLQHNMHSLEICVEDDAKIMPNVLPVTLNLCALRCVKLPYTKINASVFGKTLCKKWNMKKPFFKVTVEPYSTIKPFDFSTPYSNRS